MRPIKFRAWYKKNKKMQFIASLHFGCLKPYHGQAGDLLTIVHVNRETAIPPVPTDLEDIELMQFTGLHDKNGKEIWEGDILGNGVDRSWPVEFNDAAFTWGIIPLRQIDFKSDRCGLEVLGNIYENPELLK